MKKKIFVFAVLLTFIGLGYFIQNNWPDSEDIKFRSYKKTENDLKMENKVTELGKLGNGRIIIVEYSTASFNELLKNTDIVFIGMPLNNFYENGNHEKVDINDTDNIRTNTPVFVEKIISNKTNKKISKNNTLNLVEFSLIYNNGYGERYLPMDQQYSVLKKGSLYIFFVSYNSEIDSFVLSSSNFFTYNLDNTDRELKEFSRDNPTYMDFRSEALRKYTKEIKEAAKNFDPNRILKEKKENGVSHPATIEVMLED